MDRPHTPVPHSDKAAKGPTGSSRPSRSHPGALAILLTLRRELVLEMDHCQAEFSGDGTTMSNDDDPAERTSQSMLTGTINHIGGRLREVERALGRLVEGSYGICAQCSKRIAKARLSMNPTAVCCLKCQIGLESGRRKAC